MQSSFPFPGRFDADSAASTKWEQYLENKSRITQQEAKFYNDSDPRRLKAEGNLSFLSFIEIVKMLWENSYPDIPIVATFGGKFAKYPCIAYGTELKRAHSQEPKTRYRERVLGDDNVYYIVEGQRFQNIISFAVMVEANAGQLDGDIQRYEGAEVADRIIEIFEDFMMEYTPVFKRLGASEFVYARRMSDTEINMDQTDIIKRMVTYMLTTEKIVVSAVGRIEQIVADIRQWVAYEKTLIDEAATPNSQYVEGMDIQLVDLFQGATPNS
jgi:hypothetical protein